MRVRDLMTVMPFTVRRETAILLAERIGALPVLYGGQLVGIVTETDFVRTFVAPAAPAA